MISFIHYGNKSMASYRYRVETPAKHLNAQINEYPADVLIFSKPIASELLLAQRAKHEGLKVMVDFCDDHFETSYYQAFAELADGITVCTDELGKCLKRSSSIVPDPYLYDEIPPHSGNQNVLWFGHSSNFYSVEPFLYLKPTIISNVSGYTPWSETEALKGMDTHDIVILPSTKSYKSPNRCLEAIRRGCFVVAEPHPSINEFPIYIGNIAEGVQWALTNPQKAMVLTRQAQDFIRERFSPKTQAAAWRQAIRGLN